MIVPLAPVSRAFLIVRQVACRRSGVDHHCDFENYTPKQILKTEIGWCEPWVFHFDNGNVTKLEIIPRPGVKSKSQLPD